MELDESMKERNCRTYGVQVDIYRIMKWELGLQAEAGVYI